ncbi:universal stress protein [Methanolobus sp. ZRKC2]
MDVFTHPFLVRRGLSIDTHELAGMKNLLIGSVAENVFRHSEVPVLIVR